MTRFDPQSWLDAASRMARASDNFQHACNAALDPPELATGASPVDSHLLDQARAISAAWHHLINGAVTHMDSDASMMKATGASYQATEDDHEDLARRSWNRGVRGRDV